MSDDLSFVQRYGPYALIAGASEGIGAAFARQLAARGVGLVLVARRAEPLERLADELRSSTSVDVRSAVVDLTAPDVDERLAAASDGLDIGLLVYNAGAAHAASDFHDEPVDVALRMVALNCVGPVVTCHRFGKAMRERGRGGIVLVGSMAGSAGCGRVVTYAATKAFDQVFAEGLWKELAPHGVHVLALIAGATDTPALARSGARLDTEGYPPMGPAEVAHEGIEHLADGPTWYAGEANRAAAAYCRTAERAQIVDLLSAGTDALYPR